MAHRPLCEWPDHTFYTPDLDYRPRERLRVIAGHVLVTLLLMALMFVPLAIGGLALWVFGW